MKSKRFPADAFPRIMQRRLSAALPGPKAQSRMAPEPRRLGPSHGSPKHAAVLLLVYRRSGELHTVLTERAAGLTTHRSQVSLPGGRIAEGESIEQAALREAQEELNLSADSVQPLGGLTSLCVYSSNHIIHPVVGWISGRPAFDPNREEVDEVLEVPLETLVEPETASREIWHQRGIDREVPCYLIQGYKVWGATAMVLSEFVALLESSCYA